MTLSHAGSGFSDDLAIEAGFSAEVLRNELEEKLVRSELLTYSYDDDYNATCCDISRQRRLWREERGVLDDMESAGLIT